MNLFQNLNDILEQGINATLIIRKTADNKMTVATHFNTDKGDSCSSLVPFVLKGSPAEIDGGYMNAIREPATEVKGLVDNLAAFKASVQTATKAAKPASVKSEEAKRIEEERQLKAKADAIKKENFDKTMKEAERAFKSCEFFTSEAVYGLALNLTEDKKKKAEIEKKIKEAALNKYGLLCNDDTESAKKNLENFKAPLAPLPSAEKPATTTEEPATPSAPDENSDTDNSDSETEDDEEDNEEESDKETE